MHAIYQNLIAMDRWKLILEGLGTTIIIALGAIVIGTLIGAAMALMRVSGNRVLAPTGMPKLAIAIVSFGVNSGAYCAEIFRAGIQGVPLGQTEAGRSLGLGRAQTMWSIVIPQAVKAVLPTYTNEFVVLIKETAVASYIALMDLTKASDMIRNATFNAWVPLLSAAVIYLCLTLGLSSLFARLERRLARSDRG